MKHMFLFLSLIHFFYSYPLFSQNLIVTSSVADLRAEPIANAPDLKLPTNDLTNPLQITQLLLNEHAIAQEEYVDQNNQKWFKINALQQEFSSPDHTWQGYPGWIAAQDVMHTESFSPINLVVKNMHATAFNIDQKPIGILSIGTRLFGEKISKDFWQIFLPTGKIIFIKNDDLYFIDKTIQESPEKLRMSIIATAAKFVGDWYSWGGRSAQDEQINISSVDCSALIQLSFLAHGLQIPRMSHEQFLRSNKIIDCTSLQPGDLIFFSSITKHSTRMDHVMLYLGDDKLLEATFADNHKVRIVSFKERMGQICQGTQSEHIVIDNDDEFFVFFGSFLHDKTMIQRLRDDALKTHYE